MMQIEEKGSKVLVLDAGGYPKTWVSTKKAILHYAKDQVGWELGEEGKTVFVGGTSRLTGETSSLTTAQIISIREDTDGGSLMGKIPAVNNTLLFRRDLCTCAYCGKKFQEYQLTRDHVHPTSKGGLDVWENVVASCKPCNNYKDSTLLSVLDWKLGYQPYAPSHVEALFYDHTRIGRVQAEYLSNFLKSSSRVWDVLDGV